ncbi:MAG: hypothetical protein KGY81_05495 [Phycisphaerae bacterium]|nr:hypothetical protein [Phycisphaerae bacterium]
MIRDGLFSETPLMLYREIYIAAVVVGAGALVAVGDAGAPAEAGFIAAMATATGLRMAAIRWEWSLPRIRPGEA